MDVLKILPEGNRIAIITPQEYAAFEGTSSEYHVCREMVGHLDFSVVREYGRWKWYYRGEELDPLKYCPFCGKKVSELTTSERVSRYTHFRVAASTVALSSSLKAIRDAEPFITDDRGGHYCFFCHK